MGCLNVTELLLSKGVCLTVHDIVEAACLGHTAVVKLLINHYRLDATNQNLLCILPYLYNPGKTPVYGPAVDMVVEECAEWVDDADEQGTPPLLCAVEADNVHVVSTLVKFGADINIGDINGQSALMVASRNKSVDVVQALLSDNSNTLVVDMQTITGLTALSFAADADCGCVVDLLLATGASARIKDKNGQNPLFAAQSAEIINKLLDAGADIDCRDEDGWTPLLATESVEVAEALIKRGADVNARDPHGRSLLVKALDRNIVEIVRLLVSLPQTQLLLNAHPSGSALGHAIINNKSKEVIELLIGAGANVNAPSEDEYAQFPLYWAEDGDIIRILLNAGADPGKVTADGFTALHYHCSSGHTDAVNLLLQRGGNIDHRGPGGQTSLMRTLDNGGHLDTVKLLLLLRSPTLLDARDDDGKTALSMAVEDNLSVIATALMDAGADVHIADENGVTPLMLCSDAGLAQMLLDRGANVNDDDLDGCTTLVHACKRGDENIVRILIENGADMYRVDSTGMTPLMTACEHSHVGAVQVLLQARHESAEWIGARSNSGHTALIMAVKSSATDCVKALLAAGAGVNAATNSGYTALHLAEDLEIARFLLEAGAEDIVIAAPFGNTALTCACKNNRIDIVKLLLEHNFDINRFVGSTPLAAAAYGGHVDVMRLLLEANPAADVNMRCSSGDTALIRAAADQPASLKLLLDVGADTRLTDALGRTALMKAACEESVRLIVDVDPEIVNQRDNKGRTAIAHFCSSINRLSILDEYLKCAKEHNVVVDVNNKDINGDTAIHVATMAGNEKAVEHLLSMDADVMGSGLEQTTSLMKPFMGRDIVGREYRDAGIHPQRYGQDFDPRCSRSLKLVLDQILTRDTTVVTEQNVAQVSSRRTRSGAQTDMSGKRQRRK
jgi:ankyrin repeat protein